MANRKIGAVIALDGEQQFKSAVTACTRELNTMKSALKLVEAQTDGQAKSLETLNKKHDALNDVLEATKKKQDAVAEGLQHAKDDFDRVGKETEEYKKRLTEAEEALEEMKKSGDATDEELKEQERIVKDLSQAVEKGEAAYDKAGARVQDWEKKLNDAKTETVKAEKAVDEIEDEMRELETATDKAADQIDDFGDEAKEAAGKTDELDVSLKSMVKNAAVNLAVDAMRTIGDKAVDAARYVLEVGSTFEASMDKVAATSGASSSEIAKLTEKAKEMGATTKFSASESADAFNYMAMAGWKTEEMLQGIDGIMALAAASGADLATTSDIVTDALTAFGESAEESGRLADIMAAASSNANTNVEMMGETFKYAAPVAGALGISMEDTAVAVGLMANSGIKASQAGTALRTGLSNLAKPTKQMKEWMDKYNIALVENEDGSVNLRETMIQLREKMSGLSETEQAAAASAIFGKNAMSGWMAVINASDDDFNQLITAIDNSNGAAQGMADTMQNNLSGAMTIFKSALEGLGIELYDKAVAPLTGAVEFATGVITKLTDALDGSRGAGKHLDDFYKSVKSANDEVERTLENAQKTKENAEAKGALLEGYKQEFIDILGECDKFKTSLDGLGGKSKQIGYLKKSFDETTGAVKETYVITDEFTKSKITAMVGELGDSVSGLKDAWHEETGELTASITELENWFGVAKEVAMYEALEDSIKDLTTAYGEAGIAQVKAQSGYEAAKKALDDFYESIGMTEDQIISYGGKLIDLQKLNDPIYGQYLNLKGAVSDFAGQVEEADKNVATAKGNLEESQGIMKDVADELENLGFWTHEEAEEAKDAAGSIGEEADATEDATDAIGDYIEGKVKSIQSTEDNADAVDEETTAVKNSGEAWAEKRKAQRAAREETDQDIASGKSMAETAQEEADALAEAIKAVHAQADAEKTLRDATQQARDDMTKAFDDIQKSVESAFNLNPFEQWQQDLSKGWEAFDGAMLSQIEGMKNYQTNMDLVREHLSGKAPDFVKFLEDMGQSGAQFVDDLARGIREGGEASISSIDYTVGLWRENHSLEDAIEDSFARSKLSAKLGLEGLTDSDVLAWEDLGYAFDEGKAVIEAQGGKLSQATTEAFWGAIDAAKAAGMQVPKGAAEAIRNSDDPEQAMIEWTGILNESLRARGEELLIHAQELGIQIPEGIANVLQDEGATAEQIYGAMDSLIATIKTKDPDFEAAGTEAGEAAGNATATGIANKSGDVENAAANTVASAKSSGLAEAQNFDEVGEAGMDSLHGGIDNEASAVATGVVDAITGAATSGESHADTRLFALGRYTVAKMITGIESRYGNAYDAGYDVVMHMTNGINAAAGKAYDAGRGAADAALGAMSIGNAAWNAGYNGALGFGNGLGAGREYVALCGRSLAYAALDAARNALAVNSPSKKFREIGDYTVQGFVEGLENGQSDVEKAVADTFGVDPAVVDTLTDFDLSSGTISLDGRSGGMNDKLDVLINIVGQYMPEILVAAEADKKLSMDDNFVPMIANRTSEIIGRNARRLM